MSDYLAIPQSEPRGGVLVLHAWWGLNAFMRSFCDRLASQGYLTLAPDLYHGSVAATIPEAQALRAKVVKKAISSDLQHSLQNLQGHPAIHGNPVGVIGFSFGAYWALWLVEKVPQSPAATIIFYGSRGGSYLETHSAYLGHFAETDPYVSAASVKKLEKNLKAAGKQVAFYSYPGTGHWFFESDQAAYDPANAELAWQRTLDLLRIRLG
jgi:carboxymethylenebutenolidase